MTYNVFGGTLNLTQSVSRSRLFEVTDIYVLVINTNLHPISHRFEVITDYCSNLEQTRSSAIAERPRCRVP